MTRVINEMAKDDALDVCYTKHSKDQMASRGITIGDLLFVFRTGIVVSYQGKGTHKEDRNIHKYKINGICLKNDREIGVVVLVEVDRLKNPAIKIQDIVTTMWND